MSKYYSKQSKSFYVEDGDAYRSGRMNNSLTVDEGRDINTGLIDLEGRPIYRLREPVGFRIR